MLKEHPLLNYYIDCNPNFVGELKALPHNIRNKFIQKFNKEYDRVEFLSKISELKFVQYFLEKGFDLDYEPKIFNKRPDLRIRKNGVEVIGDIKRFNLSLKDQISHTFFYELATELKTIELPYYIHIKQLKYFDFQSYNIKLIKEAFHSWILSNPIIVGDTFKFEDLFKIKITSTTGIKNYILFSYSTLKENIHPQKITSIIIEKLESYMDSFIEKGFPFFICIDLLFDSMLDQDDFIEKFRGVGVFDADSNSESTMLGEFYSNKYCANLTGILVCYNSAFHWIRNFRVNNYLGLH